MSTEEKLPSKIAAVDWVCQRGVADWKDRNAGLNDDVIESNLRTYTYLGVDRMEIEFSLDFRDWCTRVTQLRL